MVDSCKQFEGGYCEKVNMHVPKSWCVDVCKGNYTKHKTKTQPPISDEEYHRNRFKRNYVISVDMAKDSGKEIVREDVFVNRRQLCVICPPVDKNGCPCVGCKKWNELVFIETKCPNNRW